MKKTTIGVANDFFHDSLDFLHRYRLTVNAFYAIKSQRLKLFLDLRMAAECVMKAYVAYFLPAETSRKDAIQQVEKYSHKIKKLAAETKAHILPDLWDELEPFIEQLDALPVGLRYRLDGSDFRNLNEEFYYATVGDDDWLDQLHDTLKKVVESLNKTLSSHSRIISGAELIETLKTPTHNKYSDKARGKS